MNKDPEQDSRKMIPGKDVDASFIDTALTELSKPETSMTSRELEATGLTELTDPGAGVAGEELTGTRSTASTKAAAGMASGKATGTRSTE
jgi:hypothetical protein